MKTSAAPPLTDLSKPWGVIRFICFQDGKEHCFYSAVNEMTGDRLSGFDGKAPSINDSIGEIKLIFWGIRKKATEVIKYAGTKHFEAQN